ncbi:putative ABC transport system ATP-binding protein [Micromonospora chaiyaphumensis]|uniref:Putative ABC transport system ATP-binding protein n=2 Tax=Micromonospora chaiyaphumensis TaxID=307119 RepID=A0A1C4W346_9ACTN|nr:putative ABC transport system ATP-binding protein [Micromonospora chaiyaphumensis]
MTMSTAPAPATTVAVQARDVVRTYGRGDAAVRALDGVTVSVPAGRFTAIMGPSGSGKSTLMHALAGLDTVDAGQILLGGTDLGRLTERQRTLLRRDRIGFVFQAFNLVPTLTARENIVLPLTLAGRRPDAEHLAHLLATLGLTDRSRHRPGELSGGQQQRVAVARALVTRPEIVFADEPTGNLDSQAAETLLGFLRQAVDELGQTIVMVTHDPHAAAYADRVVFLADGRIDGELDAPTVPAILSHMARLTAPAATGGN